MKSVTLPDQASFSAAAPEEAGSLQGHSAANPRLFCHSLQQAPAASWSLSPSLVQSGWRGPCSPSAHKLTMTNFLLV